jgi:hypothetical protein
LGVGIGCATKMDGVTSRNSLDADSLNKIEALCCARTKRHKIVF